MAPRARFVQAQRRPIPELWSQSEVRQTHNTVAVMPQRFTNNLINETSPYLLQHAHNPVNWYAWSSEALELAQQQDKPILLSIGYSACHWCHVMEHESFEDEDTATFMNDHLVCIKVDREERPDLDKIYQTAHQMLTQRAGGWPLNVVIAPDTQAPFFAGTYFPKDSRYGMPSFKDVLKRVVDYYRTHRAELGEHGDAIKQAFLQTEPTPGTDVNAEILDTATRELIDSYDPVYGGFGGAPKFPHPSNIELCLRAGACAYGQNVPNPRLLHIALHTLDAMATGGLFDHLGGGFCRYSVDVKWSIPHFEKMLYDNAQLLPLYVDAWMATKNPLYGEVASSTARWIIREMQSNNGGYYSTLDADSVGEEGKFYVWSLDQLQSVLSAEEYAVMEVRFGLRGEPNFEGKWHLNIIDSIETVAQRCGVTVEQAEGLLNSARHKLFELRSKRVWPNRDEKILTSWNALMIKGMASAGRRMKQTDWLHSAQQSLQYIQQNLWRGGRLLATAKDDRAHLNAYLDDYVFLIEAILELSQARWRTQEIEFAIELADAVLLQFEDNNHGGFFFTSNDHEKLLYRTKPAADDATPSGNAVAAKVLGRLGHLIGDERYLRSSERTLLALSPSARRYASAHSTLVIAMEEFLNPPDIIIIRGTDSAAEQWLASLDEYSPRTMAFLIPVEQENLPGVLSNLKQEQQVTAYICRGVSCSAPINHFDHFVSSVKERMNNA